MKNFLSGTAMLCFALLSCTNETIENQTPEQTAINNPTFANSVASVDTAPANPANPYDLAGAAQNVLLDLYLEGNYSYTSLEEVSLQVALLAAAHDALGGQAVPATISQQQLSAILNNPTAALGAIGTSPALSTAAGTSFSGFMATLLAGQDSTFEALYSVITSYEATVVGNPAYTAKDEEVILSATSIARYTIYYKKKRKDRDWDTSVGNVLAGANGAEDNTISAVAMAVITGISINNGITQ